MPLVSIIVLVYKTEQYVRRCLDSIQSQTFRDWELIIIDDGTPDNAGIICDEYASKDSRITVIHKQNGGSASARQCGLDASRGKYVLSVDSDDWISSSMLDVMVSKAETEKADIVICDFCSVLKRYTSPVSMNPGPLYDLDLMKYVLCKGGGSLCNKLIRRDCFSVPVRIGFEKGIDMFEDMIILARMAQSERKVAYIPQPLYYYNQQNTASYMHVSKKYNNRVVLNDILFGFLDKTRHAAIINFLRLHAAFTAFIEGTFPASEWKRRFRSLDYSDKSFFPSYFFIAGKYSYHIGKALMLADKFIHIVYRAVMR